MTRKGLGNLQPARSQQRPQFIAHTSLRIHHRFQSWVDAKHQLEDVGVLSVVPLGRLRALHAEHVAQLAEEGLAVGALGRPRFFPARDEFLKGVEALRHTPGL
jgi:hypothetical protein